MDTIYHSDSLYSAVTGAMSALGLMEEWLDATARNAAGAAVRFSSCFPFQGDTGFVIPPKSVWPPAASSKVRWKGAKFVPLPLVELLLNGGVLEEDRWSLDGQSECLVPHGRGGPFRIGLRSSAAVDRLGAGVAPHATACLEFNAGAGLWTAVSFADEPAKERWRGPVQSAFRLLADSGFGGERSRGWGRCDPPEFVEGVLPDLVISRPVAAPAVVESVPDEVKELVAKQGDATAPDAASYWSEPPAAQPAAASPISHAYWLLSLFAPMRDDTIEWERGAYSVLARGGRVESPARSGELKKLQNMVCEGSVVFAATDPRGSAADVAPDGFPHPVYRAGFAVAIPIPQGPVMRYRLTCLTPVLVGDGESCRPSTTWCGRTTSACSTSAASSACWPRARASKAISRNSKRPTSWTSPPGADSRRTSPIRRIPFEHPSSSAYWERASGETLNIPTFSSGASGPYVPGAAIKGVLRTGMLFASLKPGMLRDVAQLFQGDRPPRRPAEGPEAQALGGRPATAACAPSRWGIRGP